MKALILNRIVAKLNEYGAFRVAQTTYTGKTDQPRLIFKKGNKNIAQTNVEIRKAIMPKDIPKIFEDPNNILNDDAPTIVAADYITKDARIQLREKGIGYADGVGNVFLNIGEVFIFIETDRTGRDLINRVGDRVFTKTGLKLVYNFLIHPEDINKRYRLIGGLAGVAIDTVGKVIKQLVKEGYVIKADAKNYVWRDREKLFHKWVEEYNRVLRPNLERAIAAPIEDIDWNNIPKKDHCFWGGKLAANQIVDDLIVNEGILYTHKDHFQVFRENLWYPKEDGPIIIYKAFWIQKNTEFENGYVHPIITYADLINTNDPRQMEVAQKIYEQEIEPKL